jgi:nicotinate-nucleotide adenylyltransferase
LIAARAAAQLLGLDVVHLIPARQQPFKHGGHHAAAHHRFAMLNAAVQGDPLLVADDREIRRPGTSYTIDTVHELAGEFPKDRLSLLIGADTALEFEDWRDASAIRDLARVVVITRPGIELPADSLIARNPIEVPPVPISATEVRRRVAAGETIRELVPPPVADYIERHGLYRS